jgi:hypothetical protein
MCSILCHIGAVIFSPRNMPALEPWIQYTTPNSTQFCFPDVTSQPNETPNSIHEMQIDLGNVGNKSHSRPRMIVEACTEAIPKLAL